MSLSHLWTTLTVPPFRRQIFPDKTSMKSKGKSNENEEPDKNSSQSKAKLARLERAEKRRKLDDAQATTQDPE